MRLCGGNTLFIWESNAIRQTPQTVNLVPSWLEWVRFPPLPPCGSPVCAGQIKLVVEQWHSSLCHSNFRLVTMDLRNLAFCYTKSQNMGPQFSWENARFAFQRSGVRSSQGPPFFLTSLRVAQRSERRSYKPGVEGPTPSPRTKIGLDFPPKKVIYALVAQTVRAVD